MSSPNYHDNAERVISTPYSYNELAGFLFKAKVCPIDDKKEEYYILFDKCRNGWLRTNVSKNVIHIKKIDKELAQKMDAGDNMEPINALPVNPFYDKYADVIFVAKDNVEVKSYRHILAPRSPVLQSIFEETTEIPVKIEVPQYEAVTITRFINACEDDFYLSDAEAQELFEFTKKYDAAIVKTGYADILTQRINSKNVCQYVLLAYAYELENLKVECLKFMNKNKNTIKPQAFKNFPQDVFNDILVNLKFPPNTDFFDITFSFETVIAFLLFSFMLLFTLVLINCHKVSK